MNPQAPITHDIDAAAEAPPPVAVKGAAMERIVGRPPGSKVTGTATFLIGEDGTVELAAFESPDLGADGPVEETAEDAIDAYRRGKAGGREELM